MVALLSGPVLAQSPAPGTYKGSNIDPSPANLALTWNQAFVVLPAGVAGSTPWKGRLNALPTLDGKRPVAIFIHGSGGLGDWTEEFQLWLANSLGVISIAPDSFALADRLDYSSPLPVSLYERIHTLRSAELANTLAQIRTLP